MAKVKLGERLATWKFQHTTKAGEVDTIVQASWYAVRGVEDGVLFTRNKLATGWTPWVARNGVHMGHWLPMPVTREAWAASMIGDGWTEVAA